MKKYVDGVLVDLTAEEISDFNKRLAEAPSEFDMALQDLRVKRNRLLAETDYLALSDNTLSDDMKIYRQELRDFPAGKDTVEKCEEATWPTKP